MVDHTEYSDADLWRYLDGELDAPAAEALERAAAADAELADRLDSLRLMSASILDDAPTAPEGFANRIAAQAQLQSMSAPAPSEDWVDLQRFVRRALIAAAIMAALGLGYLALEVVPDLVSPEISASPDALLEPR